MTTLYFYDAAGHLVESQDLSTTPATRRSTVFVEDEPMGVVDQPPSGAPVFSWIHADRLGTPLAVTSTPGTGSAQVVWRATYEPFGLATVDDDPDGDLQTFTLDLRFPGQVFDAESGDHDNFYRTYDPVTGRYREGDRIGQEGGVNIYGYTNENPVNAVDPLGLRPLTTCDAHPAYCTGREVPIPKPPVPKAPEPPVPIAPPVWNSPDVQVDPEVQPESQPVTNGDPKRCKNERCEQQYEVDSNTCRAIARTRNKERARRCWASAMERKVACEKGQPIPPLHGWW